MVKMQTAGQPMVGKPQQQMTYNPGTQSRAYQSMRDRLKLLRDVWGGTETLLAEAPTYLPKYEKESDAKYQLRKSTTWLRRNMFRQSVERITGRIFEVPTKVNPVAKAETLVPDAAAIVDDADQRGNSFDRIARNLYRDALMLGMRHILVDYPVVEVKNLAEERALAPRPYLVELQPEQVLRCYRNEKGQITHLAWSEVSIEWDEVTGSEVYAHRIHERFGLAETVRAKTWKRIERGVSTLPGLARPIGLASIGAPVPVPYDWQVEGEERIIKQPRIMFHTLYAEEEDFMIARTPLVEVAGLTIDHFQVGSDYRNCLKHVLFPILTATGIAQNDIGNVVMGPDTILGSTSKDAKYGFLEHNGKAIEAAFKDLESLEQRAEAYAGQLTKPSGDVKATTAAISSAEVSSFAKDMAMSLQDVLQAILDDCALWVGVESLGRVEVNMDFAVDLPDGDLQALSSMRTNGDISRQTLWKEMSRRNVLSRDFDAKDEQQLLEEQEAEAMDRERQAMEFAASLEPKPTLGGPPA